MNWSPILTTWTRRLPLLSDYDVNEQELKFRRSRERDVIDHDRMASWLVGWLTFGIASILASAEWGHTPVRRAGGMVVGGEPDLAQEPERGRLKTTGM